MVELTTADLQTTAAVYDSPRDIGDVLIGEDAARPLLEACSSGNATALQSLLSEPQWIETMLGKPHRIYSEFSNPVSPNPTPQVLARPISNLEQALFVAAANGHAAVVPTLLAFATQHGIEAFDIITRKTVIKTIHGGHAAVFAALASASPTIVHFDIGHGTLALYEAVKRRQTDVVAVLLEHGADPLHPVGPFKKIGSYNSSLLSLAAMAEDGPRMSEMLLDQGVPIAETGALHTAADRGHLDTMRLLLRHGADVNEVLASWKGWTPLHFAISKGQVEAARLLEENGARSDVEDKSGRTPGQLLEEANIA